MPDARAEFAVVMPYYKNAATLARCLTSFANQSCAQAKQIVVVDDGDEPEAEAIVKGLDLPVPIVVLRSFRQGQAQATNMAIAHCEGDWILLTCADIIATPNLLATHIKAHAQAPGAVGVIGHIDYAPWLQMTPLMQFMAQPGMQFDFAGIRDAARAPGTALYAPNFSAPKRAIIDVGLFDANFAYGYQDTDLGLRLAQAGLPFVYEAEALVWHDHPNTVAGLCARQITVHRGWARMAQRYPQRVNKDAMTALLRHYVPQLPSLSAQQRLAERAESQAKTLRTAVTTDALMALFGHLATLAMVQGMVADLPGLARVLPIQGEPWYRDACSRDKAAS